MRLFSALWPPEQAIADLERAFGTVELPNGVRRVPTAKWHLTLAFYGNDASQEERTEFLDQRLAGLRAPTLRLAGAGTFAGVLWVGAEPVTDEDREALHAVAAAAGADQRFRPHITVARWRSNRPRRGLTRSLAGYRGPAWTASEVSLVHSARGTGAGYVGVHRVPLITW